MCNSQGNQRAQAYQPFEGYSSISQARKLWLQSFKWWRKKRQRSDSWQYSFLRCGVLWVFPGVTFISLTFTNVLDLHSQMCSPGFRISKIMVNIIICCSWHKRSVKILFHNAVLLPGKHALYAATVSSGFAWAQEHASIFFGSLCALYS